MNTSIENISFMQILILLWCVVIVNVVLFFAWDLFKKRRILKFSRQFKGYKFYPIIGNGHHFFGKNIFSCTQEITRKYNLPCSIWIGHEYHYMTADAAEVKIILNHPNTFNKNSIYENFKGLFGNSLLLARFERWKRNRKILAISFSQSILNSFVESMYEKSCTLISILNESHSRDKFDIFERLTLDIFCANMMQLNLDCQVNINDELTDILHRSQDLFGRRMVTSYLVPDFIWMRSSEGKQIIKYWNRMKEIITEIIQKKRALFKKSIEFRENRRKLPLMDMMLETEGITFSDDEIFQEINLFLLAATDTSGITLAFTFTLLAMNPEAQEKVYQEVKQQVDINRPIYHDDLPNLKYTERAIQESMRLLPVTPILGRHVTADVELGRTTIPGGANVAISVFNLHRSKTYWENPLEYNPDRFLPEEVAKRDPYCFIPFSGGPRNCIGQKYAMMLMKIAVAHVIRNFEVRSKYKSVEEMEFTSCITMKTTHDLDCQFIPRTH